MNTYTVKAFGTAAPEADLKQMSIERREVTAKDVEIDILYCGVCHSDLHTARNEWGGTVYPNVPGHEIVGRITKVGEGVTKFKVGDLAGVGCMVDSCRECESCKEGLEQYCENGNVQTYNGHDKHLNKQTFRGYSERVVVDEDFVLKIAENLDPAATALLLCAGITTYSLLRQWNAGPDMKDGSVGIGGVGHMGVKIAKAMGAYVVVITTSLSKANDAKRLGANQVILPPDNEQMKANAGTLHFILDCVSAQHDINAYLSLLKRDGSLQLVGAPEHQLPVAQFS